MQRCQSSIAKLVLTVLVVCNLVLAQETNQPTAQQIYQQGMEQFNAGQHEEAKKTLGRILDELDPGLVPLLLHGPEAHLQNEWVYLLK